MNINDFFTMAATFTLVGIALALLTPKLIRAVFRFTQRVFHRPKYLKKTTFKQ